VRYLAQLSSTPGAALVTRQLERLSDDHDDNDGHRRRLDGDTPVEISTSIVVGSQAAADSVNDAMVSAELNLVEALTAAGVGVSSASVTGASQLLVEAALNCGGMGFAKVS
jgi:hypothetical protein